MVPLAVFSAKNLAKNPNDKQAQDKLDNIANQTRDVVDELAGY